MMSEKQANAFSKDSAPVEHPKDIVTCLTGEQWLREHCYRDCTGQYHALLYDRHSADVVAVEKLLNRIDESSEAYCTENEDYASDYVQCIAEEGSTLYVQWVRNVLEFVEWETEGWGIKEDVLPPGHIAKAVVDEIDIALDMEVVQNPTDYGAYSGEEISVWGFKVGEVEEQVEISSHPILLALHKADRLDDVLDNINCDMGISRYCQREKNEETGNYESVGHETYKWPDDTHPILSGYCNHSGGWDFYLTRELVRDKMADAILEYYGYGDTCPPPG